MGADQEFSLEYQRRGSLLTKAGWEGMVYFKLVRFLSEWSAQEEMFVIYEHSITDLSWYMITD